MCADLTAKEPKHPWRHVAVHARDRGREPLRPDQDVDDHRREAREEPPASRRLPLRQREQEAPRPRLRAWGRRPVPPRPRDRLAPEDLGGRAATSRARARTRSPRASLRRAAFGLFADPHRRDRVDDLEHRVGEDEGVERTAEPGRELLPEERAGAVDQTVAARRVDRQPAEDAEQDDPEQAAHPVHAPDVERVVPLERFFSWIAP